MLHALQYSIIRHLDGAIPELTEVVWMYDGVSLSGKVKPFATVEQMQDDTTILAKERAYYETIYRFQIGMMAKTSSERAKLQEKLRKALLQPDIPLFDTDGPTPVSDGFFYCDVTAVTPIPVEDLADDTNKHKVYFDVEVAMTFRNGSDQYEQ